MRWSLDTAGILTALIAGMALLALSELFRRRRTTALGTSSKPWQYLTLFGAAVFFLRAVGALA